MTSYQDSYLMTKKLFSYKDFGLKSELNWTGLAPDLKHSF